MTNDCLEQQILNINKDKSMLRFITCGSVDDGKSTLIGKLLYETQSIHEDQLNAIILDSKKYGTTGEKIDFALLVDGLTAEREQGITIDVAYRFFSTEKRKFIIADTPGHEQYIRNMATGASTASLAIVLIDASKGITEQTRRHSIIVSMFGIKHIIVAINKMDLVRYDQTIFEKIKEMYIEFAKNLNFSTLQAIPISALCDDNILKHTNNTPWYRGPTLIDQLESIPVDSFTTSEQPFRMAIQYVNRSDSTFRGFSGRIFSGSIKPKDRIKILPAGNEAEISKIMLYETDLKVARAGESVTIVLSQAVDASRGDIFVSIDRPCEVSSQFEVRLLWLNEKPMVPSRNYLFKSSTSKVLCWINTPKYRIDIPTLKHLAAKELFLNEIGQCVLTLSKPIPFEPYDINRELGSFILIDTITNSTVAAGLICFSLRRASNISCQPLLVDRTMRALIKDQKPIVLWFTGLSGAGKSTLANAVEKKLYELNKHSVLLDGDNIRSGLNCDLDFTEAGRAENIRRVSETAKLMLDAGLITLVALISPFAVDREMARKIIGVENFIEIFVDAPLSLVEGKDIKGLYKKAKENKINNFTGVNSNYEPPKMPDLHIDISCHTIAQATTLIIELLKTRKVIKHD